MSKVIRSLLMISRIDNEQFLRNESVNIKSLLEEIAEEMQERLGSKNLKLYVHHLDEFTFHKANKDLLYTLFNNIINNAIKYNVENGKIEIGSSFRNNKYVVDIRDSGVGIAKENIPYIFDRFKKFKKTTESSYGLGLAIVKTISDYHRINITVESEEHKGTIFSIEFPDEYHS